MTNTEQMVQALLSIDKKTLKARKVGGLGAPSMPVEIRTGAKLTEALVEHFLRSTDVKRLEGKPMALSGHGLDGKSPHGFLFTTTAIYAPKGYFTIG